jgi:hypothetical protein
MRRKKNPDPSADDSQMSLWGGPSLLKGNLSLDAVFFYTGAAFLTALLVGTFFGKKAESDFI